MTDSSDLITGLENMADGKNWMIIPPGSDLTFNGMVRVTESGAIYLGKEWPATFAAGAIAELRKKPSFRSAEKESVLVRPNWDEWFLGICDAVSRRATCKRLHVGALLVNPSSHLILSTGYNGSIRGMASCYDDGCDVVDGHCVRTIHGELNALISAAENGAPVSGSTLYCNYGPPCWNCFRALANASITRCVWADGYNPDPRVLRTATLKGIELRQVQIAHYILETEWAG